MNIHLKTAAILLATLIIGMVCGALILGAFARDRLQPPPQVTRERFVERWVRMVRPDQEQLQRIREVVGEHEPGFRENYMRHRQEMQVLVDSLHRDLEPILTEEQIQRIKRIRERREHMRESRDRMRESRERLRESGERIREPRRDRDRPGARNRGDRRDSNRSEERGSGGDH